MRVIICFLTYASIYILGYCLIKYFNITQINDVYCIASIVGCIGTAITGHIIDEI